MFRRRDLLIGATALALPTRAPALITSDRTRPRLPYGVMSGDILPGRAMVWSAADRSARMLVEWADNPGFRNPTRLAGPLATPATGLTASLDLARLPADRAIHYRIAFQDPDTPRTRSDWTPGTFRAPATSPRPIRFTFAGDECGQGFGINPEFGGYRLYAAMQAKNPDVFIHQGDQIYADGPLKPEVALAGGGTWRNLITPAKTHIAQTLEDFRGAYAYNLLDTHKRAFLAATPMLVQWDDHEVRNNWYPEKHLQGPVTMASLARDAAQAMLEYNPLRRRPGTTGISRRFSLGPLLDIFLLDARSHRGPNAAGATKATTAAAMLGAEQVAWLKAGLAASTATWKLIASDIPLSLTVADLNRDTPPGGIEGIADGADAAPAGREIELADILAFIHDRRIANTLWISADVHYAAAIHYAPERARTAAFTPFWEFVAGPINAGTGTMAQNPLDATFGPQVIYNSVPQALADPSPASHNQFFGMGEIDPATKALTVTINDSLGTERYRVVLPARV